MSTPLVLQCTHIALKSKVKFLNNVFFFQTISINLFMKILYMDQDPQTQMHEGQAGDVKMYHLVRAAVGQ